MYCPSCGNSTERGLFCRICGSPLGEVKKSRKTNMLILISLAIVAVVVIIALVILVPGLKESKSDPDVVAKKFLTAITTGDDTTAIAALNPIMLEEMVREFGVSLEEFKANISGSIKIQSQDGERFENISVSVKNSSAVMTVDLVTRDNDRYPLKFSMTKINDDWYIDPSVYSDLVALSEQEPGPIYNSNASGTLIVGTSGNSGQFIDGFGSNTPDNWVKKLTDGFYTTYTTSPDGEIILNETVVKNLNTQTDVAGNKTYTFTIHNDLRWNDGSKITAEDYVFNLLWYASKDWADAGAVSDTGNGLLGYVAYRERHNDRFKGVQLIDKHTFALTIDAEKLPYFYQTSYVSCGPKNMGNWAPDVKIDSNVDGAKLTSDIGDWTLASNTQLIAQTELFAPTITCGPYKFISFDLDAVNLEYNPYFKGDYRGNTPSIQHIVLRAVNNITDVDQVIFGEIDVVTGVVERSKIERAKSEVATSVNSYTRNGFGEMLFHTDFGPAADPIIRLAISHLIDRQQLIQQILDGYGVVTQGLYSLPQWMYKDNAIKIESTFIKYVLSIDKANELLDTTGYKFESDGTTPFNANKIPPNNTSYWRHNSKGQRLEWNHLGSEDNAITQNIKLQFEKNAPMAGIKFTVDEGDFSMVIDHVYHQYSSRKYHSFNLATSFGVIYDPYYSFHSDMLSSHNLSRLNDSEMDRLIMAMRNLDPKAREEYSKNWLKFQKRFNELVPTLPLYSNVYYDVFRKEVKGFNTTSFANWSDVICEMSIDN